MKVVIPIESRFTLCNGKAGSHHLTYERFWTRYLDVFDEVLVVGRLFQHEDANAKPVEGPGVKFLPLPAYTGFRGFLKQRRIIRERIDAIEGERAYILRLPGLIGGLMSQSLIRQGRPFGVEVVGDPFDVFAPGASSHPFREAFRWAGYWTLARQCRKAAACAYVSEETLQRRYPPRPGAFTTHYSSVELPDEAFVESPRSHADAGNSIARLVTIGSMEQRYKAIDVLIAAMEQCAGQGLPLHLTVLGDGRYRAELEQQVQAAGLEDHVEFLGMVPAGAAVRDILDSADIFVIPSRTEGLPRSLIEAMARGLPSLGSTAGGIPELLGPEDTVKPDDVSGLAELITAVANNPERLDAMSQRNLEKSRGYHRDLLQQRRRDFYRHVRQSQTGIAIPQKRAA